MEEDWNALGAVVAASRKASGYAKTSDWVAATGKSDRQLLGLERGEPKGRETLEAIEDALNWPRAWTYKILNGVVVGPPPQDDAYVVDRGPEGSSPGITDDEVVAVIERQQRELAELLEKVRARQARPVDGPS